MSFHELKKDKERIYPLFPSLDHHVTIEAAVEGTCEGKIFVDNIGTPHTAVVWTAPLGEALLYIGGSHDNDVFNEHLLTYFNEVIKPESIKEEFDSYEIYPTRNWEPVLQSVFQESMFKEIDSYYILNPVKFREYSSTGGMPSLRDFL